MLRTGGNRRDAGRVHMTFWGIVGGTAPVRPKAKQPLQVPRAGSAAARGSVLGSAPIPPFRIRQQLWETPEPRARAGAKRPRNPG